MDSKQVAIGLGVVLVATLVGGAWYISRLDSRLASLEGARQHPTAAPVVPGAPITGSAQSAAPTTSVPVPLPATVALDTFSEVWRGSPQMRRAESECWEPAGPAIAPDAFIHFDIEVSSAGRITKAEQVRVRGPAMNEPLTACLGKIVQTLQFPPSGAEQRTRVMVGRR